MKMKTLALIASLSSALPAAAAGFPESTTGTLFVSLTVPASCMVTAGTPVNMTYQSSTGDFRGNGAVAVACTGGTAFQVNLGNGANYSIAGRQVTGNGGATVAYELFKDAGLGQAWTSASSNDMSGIGLGIAMPLQFPVYGKAYANPMTATGSYSDQVTVTVAY